MSGSHGCANGLSELLWHAARTCAAVRPIRDRVTVGVNQPDFGVLFDDMVVPEHGTIDLGRLIAPKIEVEVAFLLGQDLETCDLARDQIRASISYALPALEIVDSRIADWDISIVDTVADKASSGLYVLGAERTNIDGLDLSRVSMELRANGIMLCSGSGGDCLGGPLAALAWLAQTCRDYGTPLRAGEAVLSGALGPMVRLEPENEYSAVMSGIGTVRTRSGT